MDDNKLAKLREIHYKLQKSCMLCTHSTFSGLSNWGSCKKFEYKHLKHQGPKRRLSIHGSGVCDHFIKNEHEAFLLYHYTEFGEWIKD